MRFWVLKIQIFFLIDYLVAWSWNAEFAVHKVQTLDFFLHCFFPRELAEDKKEGESSTMGWASKNKNRLENTKHFLESNVVIFIQSKHEMKVFMKSCPWILVGSHRCFRLSPCEICRKHQFSRNYRYKKRSGRKNRKHAFWISGTLSDMW